MVARGADALVLEAVLAWVVVQGPFVTVWMSWEKEAAVAMAA
jgi:hypothetical protein